VAVRLVSRLEGTLNGPVLKILAAGGSRRPRPAFSRWHRAVTDPWWATPSASGCHPWWGARVTMWEGSWRTGNRR